MSRIGKLPVTFPETFKVTVDDKKIKFAGPKGELTIKFKSRIGIEVQANQVIVTRKNDAKATRALHGTIRNLIKNAVLGVTEGFEKRLELIGTGYRVALQGKDLNFSLGFSHPVIFKAVDGIEYKVDGQNKVIVWGIDKHQVGQIAANIRELRPPEPYKGKGIRYENEVIIKKAGKQAKSE